jgi:hypothetical protein
LLSDIATGLPDGPAGQKNQQPIVINSESDIPQSGSLFQKCTGRRGDLDKGVERKGTLSCK